MPGGGQVAVSLLMLQFVKKQGIYSTSTPWCSFGWVFTGLLSVLGAGGLWRGPQFHPLESYFLYVPALSSVFDPTFGRGKKVHHFSGERWPGRDVRKLCFLVVFGTIAWSDKNPSV